MSDWRPRALGEFLAAAPPDAEALVTPTRRLAYGGLHDAAERVARALQALGLGRGDHVALLMGSDEYWLALFYGAALIGAVTVPLDPRGTAREIEIRLRQADCKALFLATKFMRHDVAAMLKQVRAPKLQHRIVLGSKSWRAFAALDRGQAIRRDAAPEDLLLIQFPSGATARPRGAMLTHDNVLRNAWAAGVRIGVRAGDRYFGCLPFFEVGGSTLSALLALVHGACLVTRPAFEAGTALAMMEKERCTLTSGDDTVFELLMGHAELARRRLSLRGGWAAAGPRTMRRIVDVLGAKHICAAYGLPEAAPNVAMSDWRDPEALRVQGLATPHEGLHLRTVDGEIQVRGWSVMRGYYGDPEASAQAFTADGFLRTGDLGEVHPGGRLRALGRA